MHNYYDLSLNCHYIFQFPFGLLLLKQLPEWGVTFGAQATCNPWQDSEIRTYLRVGVHQKETPPQTCPMCPSRCVSELGKCRTANWQFLRALALRVHPAHTGLLTTWLFWRTADWFPLRSFYTAQTGKSSAPERLVWPRWHNNRHITGKTHIISSNIE